MDLYIYYDVAIADAGSVAASVRAMQATLGLPASGMKLLRRADMRGERQTWMEIYENVPDDFEARWIASVDAHDLADRTGARHIERFMAVA